MFDTWARCAHSRPRGWPRHRSYRQRHSLAGSLAEIALLGHAIEHGYRGDVAAWRRGLGRTAAMTPHELDALVGVPFELVRRETQRWADASAERIRRLVGHLALLSPPAEMPYDEVISLLTAD